MTKQLLNNTAFFLIIVMCTVRLGIALIAWINPEFIMLEFGFPKDTNTQAVYLGHIWASRDIVLSILVLYFLIKDKKVLINIVVACIAIDFFDIISAHLGFVEGIFNQKDSWNLQLTAIFALVPETIAIIILRFTESVPILTQNKFKHQGIVAAILSVTIIGLNVTIVHISGTYAWHFFCDRYVKPNPQTFDFAFMESVAKILIISVDIVVGAISLFIIRLIVKNFHYYLQHQESQTLQLDAELKLLRSQINPHFLFNTFHTLYSLVLTKSEQAPNMVLMLAELMRYSYQTTENAMVPLTKELQHIETFLALQQLRLGERADVQCIIHGNINQWNVPPLLLLTFIENAFKHGLEEQTHGHLLIALESNEKRWRFFASNSRPNILTTSFAHSRLQKKLDPISGTGLKNVQRRLSIVYGNNYYLHIEDQPSSFTVELEVLGERK